MRARLGPVAQIGEREGRIAGRTDAEGQGQVVGIAQVAVEGVKIAGGFLHPGAHVLFGGLEEQKDELILSNPGGQLAGAQLLLQTGVQVAEHPVARRLPKGAVDEGEGLNIAGDQGIGSWRAGAEELLSAEGKTGLVIPAGHRVHKGGVLQLPERLPLAAAVEEKQREENQKQHQVDGQTQHQSLEQGRAVGIQVQKGDQKPAFRLQRGRRARARWDPRKRNESVPVRRAARSAESCSRASAALSPAS